MTERHYHCTLVVVLFWYVGCFVPAILAQQTDALKKQFLEYLTLAEKGDAKAQYNLGCCFLEGLGALKGPGGSS